MANLIGYEEKSVHLLTEPKKVFAVYLVKKLESMSVYHEEAS